MVSQTVGASVVSTGNKEIDRKLGGGIPAGSLVLLEGQSDSGKSVISQHFAHAALTARRSIACYTTENTVKSLMSQMSSLDLDVTDYFLCDRLRVYPMPATDKIPSEEAFKAILGHFGALPESVKLIIVDSLTSLVAHSEETAVIDFFANCKQLCDQGKIIIIVCHSYAFENQLLTRVRSLCDAHLALRMEQVGERLIKVMEIAKVRNADQAAGNVISFDIEPGMGLKIIPISKAKV